MSENVAGVSHGYSNLSCRPKLTETPNKNLMQTSSNNEESRNGRGPGLNAGSCQDRGLAIQKQCPNILQASIPSCNHFRDVDCWM